MLCDAALELDDAHTFSLFIVVSSIFLFFSISGTSETREFDERSPSGNDYLAEVKNTIIKLKFIILWSKIALICNNCQIHPMLLHLIFLQDE